VIAATKPWLSAPVNGERRMVTQTRHALRRGAEGCNPSVAMVPNVSQSSAHRPAGRPRRSTSYGRDMDPAPAIVARSNEMVRNGDQTALSVP